MTHHKIVSLTVGIVLIGAGIGVSAPVAQAAGCHVVTSTGSGAKTGADWNNAYAGLPSTLTRGDTYYLADGAYAPYTFNTPDSGTASITIKKAIMSDHCTDAGWSAGTMGSAQAVFASAPGGYAVLFVTSDYLIIDGQTRTSSTSGHGIKFDASVISNTAKFSWPINATGTHDITLRYIELRGGGDANNLTYPESSIRLIGASNVLIEYSYLHDSSQEFILMGVGSSNITLQNSVIAHNRSSSVNHGQAISEITTTANNGSSNVVIKNNWFLDIEGTADIVSLNAGQQGISDRWSIYGNVFSYTPGNPTGRLGTGNGVIACINGNTCSNWLIINNTFANLGGGPATINSGINWFEGSGGTPIIENNLWYNNSLTFTLALNSGSVEDYNTFLNTGNSGGGSFGGTGAHDYILSSGASNPFINDVGGNYRLLNETIDQHLNDGLTLSSPYTMDPDGTTRGADGTWDRGAYEYALSVHSFYVRPNGSTYGNGSGSDWSNAFAGMPAMSAPFWQQVHGGDVIYVAGGTYTTVWDINGGGVPGSPLVLKRATISDHGTDVGWSIGLDSQVHVYGFGIAIWQASYVTINGVVKDGIYVDSSQGAMGHLINLTPNNANPKSYITLQNLKLQGPGLNLGTNYSNTSGIHGAVAALDHITVQNVESFNFSDAPARIDATNLLLDHVNFHDTCDAVNHTDLIIMYDATGIIRDSRFYNSCAAGIALANYETGTDFTHDLQIYDNLMYQTSAFLTAHGLPYLGNAIELQRESHTISVYNNTIVNWNHPFTSTRIGDSGLVYNNIFYGGAQGGAIFTTGSGIIHDYNWYLVGNPGKPASEGPAGVESSSNPFVDINSSDLHLQNCMSCLAIDHGKTLASEYATDLDNTPRPQGSAWDIGAYEYVSSVVTPDTTPPSVPANLSVSNITSSSLTLLWTASTDNVGVAGYRVYRGGTQIASVSSPSYSDAGLTSNTTYTYTVSAYDGAGNVSVQSSPVSATTLISSNTTKFVIGDRVKVTTSKLNVRATPAGKNIGFQYLNAQGTVIGGPVSKNGYIWWQINYDVNPPDGWSAQDWLEKVVVGQAAPQNLMGELPSSFGESREHAIQRMQDQLAALMVEVRRLGGRGW